MVVVVRTAVVVVLKYVFLQFAYCIALLITVGTVVPVLRDPAGTVSSITWPTGRLCSVTTQHNSNK